MRCKSPEAAFQWRRLRCEGRGGEEGRGRGGQEDEEAEEEEEGEEFNHGAYRLNT